MTRHHKNGFTLIEVLIVVAILGGVLGFAIPSAMQIMRHMQGDQFIETLSADLYLAANEALSYRGIVRVKFEPWNGIYVVHRIWETYQKKVKIPAGFVVSYNFGDGTLIFNELGHVLQGGTITVVYPNGVAKKITVYMVSGRFAISTA
ncbi:GspH/FimT family pseudopilin [Aneurinibacillus danicus]|jgi:prepilin-type N-terminal cleavage/methylation domain-containing protein|uniref:General secretion pathway GspH domain-containing protein n=1 Tax=Aneurinibacillus danicus TaxID=267746 RepID=A0A511V7U5_9BACL|nr:GspH/FimT family pseudopilin [Aneurinibacillus danicus]GEN35007.1 hypothetical protein ADA01nite_24670 [Aneurinibacillus danicus]